MTRLEAATGSAAQAGIRTSFSPLAALTSPVQGTFGRRFHGEGPPLAPPAGGAAGRMLAMLLVWQQRARQRRQLLEMNDHLLRDIGITRADALGEAGKPFWRG